MFRALGENGINIQGISTSVSSVTCMISSLDLEKALTVLHQAFILP
jgi:aspartokinase